MLNNTDKFLDEFLASFKKDFLEVFVEVDEFVTHIEQRPHFFENVVLFFSLRLEQEFLSELLVKGFGTLGILTEGVYFHIKRVIKWLLGNVELIQLLTEVDN